MKRDKQAGFSIVEAVIVVAVLGVIGVAGWFVYQHNRVKTTEAAANNTTNNQQATTTQPTSTPAAYTSTAGGFSFTYPAGWQVTEQPPTAGVTTDDIIYITTPAKTATQPNADGFTNTNRLSMTLTITTNADSSPHKTASDQTIQKLANGINLWTPSAAQTVSRTSSTRTFVCPQMAIINNTGTHFSYALANGQYLTLYAGYCGGQGDTTTLTYQQQLASQDWQAAIGVMQSMQFK